MNLTGIVIIGLLLFVGYEVFLAPNPMPFFEKFRSHEATPTPNEPTTPTEPTNTSANESVPFENTSTEPINELEVDVIDVSQGDAILVRYPDNQFILVDGGPRYKASALTNYLRAKNITTINTVVATHNDADHIGGLNRVFSDFQVERFMYVDQDCSTLTCEEMMKAVDAEGSDKIIANTGVTYYVDNNTRTQILNPPNPLINSSDKNDNSIVLKITYGSISFLLTGDCSERCENAMMEVSRPLDSDVLKVAHHGSNTGSSTAFLDLVTPAYSVISVGAYNQYGMPTKDVLSRLANIDGNRIYRTDELGTVSLVTDGEKINVEVG